MDLQFTIPEIFYLFGAFHGIFLASYLITARKSHKANRYLALLVYLFSFYLFENALYSSGYITHFPHLIFSSLPLIYLIAPLFYLYSRNTAEPDVAVRLKDTLHLVPFVIELIILWSFYTLPANIKLKVYEATQNNDSEFQFSIYFIGYLIYVISSLIYFYLSFRLLSQQKEKRNLYSETRIKWIRQSSIVFFSYIAISLLLSVISFYNATIRDFGYHANLILQTSLIQLLGYVPFINPEAFASFQKKGNGKKYTFSSLNPETLKEYRTKLLQLMTEGEPYIETGISPEYFVQQIGISKHHLSQLLTEELRTNFYDFINKYRIEKAKALLLEDDYRYAKILHIAYDCGFSNKSTFLRSFKKNTGLTPSEFKKKKQILVSHN